MDRQSPSCAAVGGSRVALEYAEGTRGSGVQQALGEAKAGDAGADDEDGLVRGRGGGGQCGGGGESGVEGEAVGECCGFGNGLGSVVSSTNA